MWSSSWLTDVDFGARKFCVLGFWISARKIELTGTDSSSSKLRERTSERENLDWLFVVGEICNVYSEERQRQRLISIERREKTVWMRVRISITGYEEDEHDDDELSISLSPFNSSFWK